MSVTLRLALGGSILLLAGCTCDCPKKQEQPAAKSEEVARAPRPAPAAASAVTAGAPRANAGEPQLLVTIEAQDTPLAQVLESLGRQTGRNFVAEPRAQDLRVTLVLHDVSWRVALDFLCQRYGLEQQEIAAGSYLSDPPRVTLDTSSMR